MFKNIFAFGFAALLSVVVATQASAVTVDIDAYDNGWYSKTGFHSVSNTNIIAGPTYRNFFAFDLTKVVGSIKGATLTIFGDNGRFNNSSNTASYALYNVSTAVASLTDGSGGRSAYKDLGAGTLYGKSRIATPTDSSNAMPSIVVAMDNAVADINAALGGKFAIGGKTNASSYLWGYSKHRNYVAAKLTLDVAPIAVPLPAGLLMLLTGLVSLWAFGRVARKTP